ncbi:hypothetical protein LEP1GSC058_4072 [Leptospira fainei serovar Hurstbridge str. BUT 6]|uniref:Uncharacterized protein n=1 Tax=Leptospira fainei serovar Hurstbridge str. BUT 6 TaxID=1193011 RepID=S3UV47_9LEPT|nr:hypothetical protein LEP1GSC058_4072 [Leptospira fainei serovar Hurstbridge str. BUT 6]
MIVGIDSDRGFFLLLQHRQIQFLVFTCREFNYGMRAVPLRIGRFSIRNEYWVRAISIPELGNFFLGAKQFKMEIVRNSENSPLCLRSKPQVSFALFSGKEPYGLAFIEEYCRSGRVFLKFVRKIKLLLTIVRKKRETGVVSVFFLELFLLLI